MQYHPCLWTLGKCSLPLWTTHTCGPQRGARPRKWNICLPSSLPSWSSTASVCCRFPPQVRGLTPHLPDLSSTGDCDIYPAGSFSQELSIFFHLFLHLPSCFQAWHLCPTRVRDTVRPTAFYTETFSKDTGMKQPLPQECLESVVVKIEGYGLHAHWGKTPLSGLFQRYWDENTGKEVRFTVPQTESWWAAEERREQLYRRKELDPGGSRFSELRGTGRQASASPSGAVRGADRALSLFNFWAVCREREVGRRSEVLSHDQITISRQFVIECRKVGRWGKSMIWTKEDYKNLSFSFRILN